MRAVLSNLGTLLVVASLGGLAALAIDMNGGHDPSPTGAPPAGAGDRMDVSIQGRAGVQSRAVAAAAETDAAGRSTDPAGAATPGADTPDVGSRVTRIAVPRISLDADVVPAALIERDGGTTWGVPAFKAGHADYTAGAGEPGNVVLLGHLSSRSSGNVFEHLDRVRVGDIMHVFSGSRRFTYQAVDVQTVGRTDVSVLEPRDVPSLSLVTCTGLWRPTIWDYTERLVVRADLVPPTE